MISANASASLPMVYVATLNLRTRQGRLGKKEKYTKTNSKYFKESMTFQPTFNKAELYQQLKLHMKKQNANLDINTIEYF